MAARRPVRMRGYAAERKRQEYDRRNAQTNDKSQQHIFTPRFQSIRFRAVLLPDGAFFNSQEIA